MKLAQFLPSMVADFRAIIDVYGIDLTAEDHGKSGLKVMHALHTVQCRNRAYDDNHPGFAGGHWKRVLPHDGRDYCFLYVDGANDTHVETLLRAVKKTLLA